MDIEHLLEHRRAKDEQFATSETSPLEPGARETFTGLDYFSPRADLVFQVTPRPGDGSEVRIATSDQRERVYRRARVATLDIESSSVDLTLYDTGHHGLFLPFKDATSGVSTYGGGRYLDLDPSQDGTVTIDFNLAYNPLCVYSDGYSCPIPPRENWLDIAIEAGEKSYTRPL
jgi:uncharacterized protein (DUF1684 family)